MEELARGLIASPVEGRFHFNEVTRELEIIQPSVSGRSLNTDETLKRLNEAIFSPASRTAPLAFEYILPRYHNDISATSLGITEKVSEATTYFTGSTLARRANIVEAASRFDGVIIGPGEEFSFNNILGDINIEGGFVQSKVIFQGRTVDGVGGGVCQVSDSLPRSFQRRIPDHRALFAWVSRGLLRDWRAPGLTLLSSSRRRTSASRTTRLTTC
jgi:vancomycin resistance protein YoaR